MTPERPTDYYKELGVTRAATDADIKKAYRRLALQWHPDVNNDPAAEEQFRKIDKAYQELMDPESRRSLDVFLASFPSLDDIESLDDILSGNGVGDASSSEPTPAAGGASPTGSSPGVSTSSPEIFTSTLRDAVVGTPYRVEIDVLYGEPPYSFTITGDLPDGLVLDEATGVISGTPRAAGSTTFELELRDAMQQWDVRELTITVVAAPATSSRPFIKPRTLPVAVVGEPYSARIEIKAASPIRWSGRLPTGLSFDPVTGEISGTPAATTPALFRLQITDVRGQSASRDFMFGIASPATPAPSILPGAVSGEPYSESLWLALGPRPGWHVAGMLGGPPELVLTADAHLEGTPLTVAKHRLVVVLRNAGIQLEAKVVQLEVASPPPPPSFGVNGALPLGQVGKPYDYTIPCGVAPPAIWEIRYGGLPRGLDVDRTGGRITGVPVEAGSTDFTLGVTDSRGQSSVEHFTIEIGAPPPAQPSPAQAPRPSDHRPPARNTGTGAAIPRPITRSAPNYGLRRLFVVAGTFAIGVGAGASIPKHSGSSVGATVVLLVVAVVFGTIGWFAVDEQRRQEEGRRVGVGQIILVILVMWQIVALLGVVVGGAITGTI